MAPEHEEGDIHGRDRAGKEWERRGTDKGVGQGGGGGAEGKLNKLRLGTQFSISKSGEELAW